MHDPMTVLFEMRRPWPTRSRMPKREADPGWRNRFWGNVVPCPDRTWQPPEPVTDDGHRWTPWRWRRHALRTPFWRWANRRWYFPALITVWHVDRNECGNDSSCTAGLRMIQVKAHGAAAELKEQYAGYLKRNGRYPRQAIQADRLARFLWWAYRHWHWTHPHHWRIQVRPLQSLARMLDKCEGCGKRFTYGYAPVSSQWGGSQRPSRFGSRPGLRHHDCQRARNAEVNTSVG